MSLSGCLSCPNWYVSLVRPQLFWSSLALAVSSKLSLQVASLIMVIFHECTLIRVALSLSPNVWSACVYLTPAYSSIHLAVTGAHLNVPETLMADERFSTLVAAVEAAGLVEAISAEPYTIFAPTNDAFMALLMSMDMTAEELLADTELLTNVLTYHVVPMPMMASMLMDGQMLTTLQGGNLTVSIMDMMVNIMPMGGPEAMVIEADIGTNTGAVIHAIDGVLLP